MLEKQKKRHKRHKRLRAKIFGKADRPRLCVFRSTKHIYCQLVDDEKKQTLAAASDLEIKKPKAKKEKTETETKAKKTDFLLHPSPLLGKERKTEEAKGLLAGKLAVAYGIGKLIAEKALKKKIKEVVFDRGGYQYHGRVKAVADGAREGGLKF